MVFGIFKKTKKSSSTNSKRINKKTGYQMSTDKQIKTIDHDC